MDKQVWIKDYGFNWGFTGTVDEFCAKAKKQEGYDGIVVAAQQKKRSSGMNCLQE